MDPSSVAASRTEISPFKWATNCMGPAWTNPRLPGPIDEKTGDDEESGSTVQSSSSSCLDPAWPESGPPEPCDQALREVTIERWSIPDQSFTSRCKHCAGPIVWGEVTAMDGDAPEHRRFIPLDPDLEPHGCGVRRVETIPSPVEPVSDVANLSADWRKVFNERTRTRVHDGGQSREAAEAAARQDVAREMLRAGETPYPSHPPNLDRHPCSAGRRLAARVPRGWSDSGWAADLRRRAGLTEIANPPRASELRSMADAIDPEATE